MVKMHIAYEGHLRTSITHEPSGNVIFTDAPTFLNGKGESFSPGDLLAASLASCVVTTLAIYGEKKGWDLLGTHLEIEKIYNPGDNRISALHMKLKIPLKLFEEELSKIEKISKKCTVHGSLHPDIIITLDVEPNT